MVIVKPVSEVRPNLPDVLGLVQFAPRTDQIYRAYQWGQQLHEGQKRLNGEPYFETHCVWVANFIDRLVQNETWTIAALLHDSVEDRGISLDEIRSRFSGVLGEQVASLVDGVTKLQVSLGGKSKELETLRKIAMFRNPGVFLVKLADKSHNIMTLAHMPYHRRLVKAEEAIRAYGKLAGILNCYTWRRWLEDMAFPHFDGETFDFVKVSIDRDPRMQLSFINDIMGMLGKIMVKEGITGRIEIIANGYWQAWQKLKRLAHLRKSSLENFKAVNDLISFRMVLDGDSEKDCYILLSALNRFLGDKLDQGSFDDYIACPQNGYRALQVTAWWGNLGAIEIAIMTEDMESENLWGIVNAIRRNLDISQYSPVTILTPTGGLRFVPEGSSVLDAIASIKNEYLLDKVSSILVNDNLVKLSDHVYPGDVVEVLTGDQRLEPTEEWLKISNLSTSRLLRGVIAVASLKRSAEKGKSLIMRLLMGRGILALEDVAALDGQKIDILLGQTACANLDDLYSVVGGEAIRLGDISEIFDELEITKKGLKWTTICLIGNEQENQPGVLARLLQPIANQAGNILRVVNDTLPDGGFMIRVVTKNLTLEEEKFLISNYQNIGIKLKSVEIV